MIMKILPQKWLFMFLAAVWAALAAGCGAGPQTPAGAKLLVVNLAGGDSGYPTPYAHYARGPGIFKMQLIFDSLLERGETGYIPWLAEGWDISADGRSYVFTLRKNVKWHDGKALTAADVKFSFEYFARNPPAMDELTVNGGNIIEAAEVIDDYTVRIAVRQPSAVMLGKLGRVRIIPKHIWENVQDPKKFNAREAVIGCGPYILQEYNKELGAYRFIAFKDYWGPKPRVDIIQFIPVSDSVLAFNKGEIDLTALAPDLLSKYQNSAEFIIKKNPAFWGYRLLLNLEKRPELQNKNIRQALAYAVDKEELVAKVARGAGVTASAGYLPADHIWHNKNVKQYPFDIDKARELLQGRRPEFILLTANSNEELRIAELIKISWAKAGINLTIKSVDGKTRDAAARKQAYEILLIGHGGWGNDADLLRAAYASGPSGGESPSVQGIPGYYNAAINELCSRQLAEMDSAKRQALIFQLQELIAEDIPQIPLYNTAGYIVYRPAKYDGWRYMFDHHDVTHNKLSYLEKR